MARLVAVPETFVQGSFALGPFALGAVAEAMRRLLPTPSQTLILRACLDAAGGTGAWSTWRASRDLQTTLASDRAGVKGLLPLLAYALEQKGARIRSAVLAPGDLSVLRMARYREQLRMERYYAIMRRVFARLQAGGIAFVLLKGGALAQSVYPERTLRHCHDIDLLLHPDDLRRAADLLLAEEFRHATPHLSFEQAVAMGDLQLDHESGLPVALHTRLFDNALHDLPPDGAWQTALPMPDEQPLLTLAPEWELVHILGTALFGRAALTWVCDAHFLIAAHPTLNWESVCAIAEDAGLAIPAYAMLAYLGEQHRVTVPSFVFDRLQRHFAAIDYGEAEQILQCVRRQRQVRYGDFFAAARSWQERAFLLRWMLLPLPVLAQGRGATFGSRRSHLSLTMIRFHFLRALRFLARRMGMGKVMGKIMGKTGRTKASLIKPSKDHA